LKKKINNYLNNIPYRLFSKSNFFYETLISIEEIIWKKNYENKKIDTFLYVCGYPRSGTTVITNFLNLTKKFSSYTHKDMPLILSPILWSKFSSIYYKGFKDIKRKHDDSMLINLDFADSFEEVIWKNFKKNSYFFEIYLKNIKKIVYLRNKSKYLSKSNQNLARINLIKKNIPDSKFLIIFRNPISQLKSLMKVNQIFFDEISKNSFFLNELDFLGHYEFGPKRKFIFENLKNLKEIKNNWYEGNFALSYIQEWIDVHQMILNNYLGVGNINFVNYDDLRNNFQEETTKILEFCEVDINQIDIKECLKLFNFDSSSVNYKVDIHKDNILKDKIIHAQKLYEKLSKINS